MKIATWNVNSIRSRLDHVLAWLKTNPVDALLLQEIKCVNDQFPKEPIEDAGYNLAVFGQKTYNGVAILSKHPIEDVQENIPGFEDEQSRYIEAVINNKRIASVYVPNGSEVGSEKYDYKLSFLEAFYNHLKTLYDYDEQVIIGGDYNIAPTNMDVYDPKIWHDRVLCSVPERRAWQKILNIGYVDALRALHPDKQQFTWWDYRKNSYENNLGLRIDHFLVSPQAADSMKDVYTDEEPRKQQKASDHIPVIIEF